jgi:hypothetical protein
MIAARIIQREERTAMGLLDWLLGKDPTGDWPATFSAPLEYDFDKHALCGVRIGSPVSDLRKLGRTEDAARARKGSLRYYTKGFQIDLENGHAMDFSIFWTTDWSDPANEPQPFRGKARLAGSEIRLDAHTTEPDLLSWFGQPASRDEDEESVTLRFTRPGNITYEFDLPAGKLAEMIVIAEAPAPKRR